MNWAEIKLLAMDVDGVLTDGSVFIGVTGEVIKSFNVRDGMAASIAVRNGLNLALITGRCNGIVRYRAKELGISYCFEDVRDKQQCLCKLMSELNLSSESVAYIGDDLNDLAPMSIAGIKIAPCDAVKEVTEFADYVSKYAGGQGIVREIVEKILRQQDKWDAIVEKYKLVGQGDRQ